MDKHQRKHADPKGWKTIKTSQPNWLKTLARTYKNRQKAFVIDDAGFGVNPQKQTLIEMAKKARLSASELAAVCIALGMSIVGITMVLLAFYDPEPTSKLWLLIGGGATCILTGGLTAIMILTKEKPPNVRVDLGGFEISWG